MNTTRTMRNIATIQLVIAFGCCLICILPSLECLISIYFALPTIVVWWLGIRLMIGYYNISQGKQGMLQTRRLWFESLIFNVTIAVIGISLSIISSEITLGYFFLLMPSVLGSILAICALLLPPENNWTLEHKTF